MIMKQLLTVVLLFVVGCSYIVCTSTGSPRYEPGETIGEKRIQQGKEKLQEVNGYAQHSPCWKEALNQLHSTCKTMTDSEQMRLALSFSNCHFQNSDRQTYPCPPNISVSECTNKNKMDDSAFQIYTEFYTHSNNMCYFIQSQLWQENTETTINKLSDTSEKAVEKLEESLEYHKELEQKQNLALENQKVIIDQDLKISQSLKTTRENMDQAFLEMYEKAENQKVILDNVLGTLQTGFGNIQWLLSSILGEIITLETAGFFIITFLLVSFLPQFGTSRLWLYITLLLYGLFEGIVRRSYFMIVSPSSPNTMSTLHSILWYIRWIAIVSLSLVYLWRFLVYSNKDQQHTRMLQDMQKQLFHIHRAVNVGEEIHEERRISQNFDSSFVAEETDDDVIVSTHSSSPVLENSVPVHQLYKQQNNEGIITGTQLIDFLSGIYIKNHAHILTDNETATQLSTDTDYTYLPVSDTNTDYEESNLTRNPLFHSNNDIITGAILTEDQLSLASQVTPSHSPIVTSNSFSSQNSSISLSLPRCTLPSVVRARSKNVIVEKEVEDVSDSSSVLSESRSRKQGKYRRESTPVANEKKQEKVKTKRRVLPVSLLKDDLDSGFSDNNSSTHSYSLRPRKRPSQRE